MVRMIRFENTITIDCPLEEVFAFVSDFENVPRWNYNVDQVRKTKEGPITVGTTFHQIRKSDEEDFSVVEYRPGEAVTIRTAAGTRPFVEMRFTFARGAEATEVTDAWKLDSGLPGFVEILGREQVRAAVMQNLKKLKQLLETGSVRLQNGRTVRLQGEAAS
jgi:uncharacterized membrane protein